VTVQSCHAAFEAGKHFFGDHEHPHLVVLGVPNEHALYKAMRTLDTHGVRYRPFYEPDQDNQLTSIATEVVFGERRSIFRKYQCLKGASDERNCAARSA
jgi:hypothetical protein